MSEVTRRDAIKLAATGAALAVGGTATSAQDKNDEKEDRSLVYGNRGRREWWLGRWWWVMDYDHRYPNGWDRRRRCGDTGEHWIEYTAIVHIQRKGYCAMLPGRPAWYEVKLVGGVRTAAAYAEDAKSFAFEKKEEMNLGKADTSKPPEDGKK